MAETITIPTLTLDGHVTQPAEQMSRLFLYFLASMILFKY
jgi:hypothetical protein